MAHEARGKGRGAKGMAHGAWGMDMAQSALKIRLFFFSQLLNLSTSQLLYPAAGIYKL
jgi:hypothetical protein